MQNSLRLFWQKCPLLFLSISLTASYESIHGRLIFLLLLLFLWAPYGLKKGGLWLVLSTLFVSFFPSNTLPHVSGKQHELLVESRDSWSSRFSQQRYLYRGKVHNQPVSWIDGSSKRFVPGKYYQVQGDLLEKEGHYILKRAKKTSPKEMKKEDAYLQAKFHLKTHIQKLIKTNHNSDFHNLYSVLTLGGQAHSLYKFQFSRYQLSHLLVISGFHFSLLALLLIQTLSKVLSLPLTFFVALLTLSFYFALLPFSPSIERAFLAQSIFLLGALLGRKSFALNSLGAALLIILIFFPTSLEKPAAILSFLLTGSILLFYPFIARFIHAKSLWKKSIALSLSIQLAALPLSLCLFHKVSLLGILFNLFIPWYFSLVMLTLIASLVFSAVPYFPSTIFSEMADFLILQLMRFLEIPWHTFDLSIRTCNLSPQLLTLYFFFLLFIGAILHKKQPLSTLPAF